MPKLLIVEDDPRVREMLCDSLAQEGYSIRAAEDGEQALEMYAEEPADVVLMDIIMPRKDGVAATHDLRRKFPNAKIIAISGGSPKIGGEHLLGTAEAMGAARTFTKPVDIGRLINAIEDLINQ